MMCLDLENEKTERKHEMMKENGPYKDYGKLTYVKNTAAILWSKDSLSYFDSYLEVCWSAAKWK